MGVETKQWAASRKRLVGVRLIYRDDDGRAVVVVEWRLDGRGHARAVIGGDTMAAATYGRGAAAPSGCYEGWAASACAARYGIPLELGRVYGHEEGVPFLICVLADNRPRTYTWSEPIEEDG